MASMCIPEEDAVDWYWKEVSDAFGYIPRPEKAFAACCVAQIRGLVPPLTAEFEINTCSWLVSECVYPSSK